MMFDEEWISSANDLVASHDTGAVPEFAVWMRLEDPNGHEIVSVHGEDSRTRFAKGEDGQPDCIAVVSLEQAQAMFGVDDQAAAIDALLIGDGLTITGDLARAQFFYRGIVRNAGSGLVSQLRALA